MTGLVTWRELGARYPFKDEEARKSFNFRGRKEMVRAESQETRPKAQDRRTARKVKVRHCPLS